MLVKGFCPDFVAKNADFNAKRRLYGFFPVHKMESWMQSEGRKPLILRGARQTGKTTLVRDFGQKFDSFIELNLEKKADSDLFERELPVTPRLAIWRN